MEKLVLVPYDKSWLEKFHSEKDLILHRLDDKVIYKIHHVGSTSIPEIISKPIIDITIEIKLFPPTKEVISTLKDIGYKHIGESDVPGRSWFVKGKPRSFHLHLTPIDGEVVKKQLKFRDIMRQRKDLHKEYEMIKNNFNGHYELDSHEYNLKKAPFVEKILNIR